MRLLITILFIISTTYYVNAQNYTEKYNDYLERYEYYNSTGDLVGYKKYNDYLEQWEYTEVSKTKSRRNSYQDFEPYEPNYQLINAVLAKKQNSFDNNVSFIKGEIQRLYKQIGSAYFNENKNKLAQKVFNDDIRRFIEKNSNADLSNSNVARQYIGYIIDIYNNTLEVVEETTKKSSNNSSKYNRNKKYTKLKYSGEGTLRVEPNVNSRMVTKISPDDEIEIIQEYYNDTDWFKIKVKGHTGYITYKWLAGY